MNPTERNAKIFECRTAIVDTLKRYEMDIGVEAMISLLAGACAAVPLSRQQPLLATVTKEIRSQYKGVARVQRKEDSEARRERELVDARGEQPQVSASGGEPGTEGDQPSPAGND